jgi:hypothetical protein
MLTEEEKNSIINEVTKAVLLAVKEEILLCLPEVIGNLMVQHISHHELNKKFYAAHKERDPLKNYEDILKEAVPEIKNRIEIMSTLDMTTVSKNPDRRFENLDAPSDSHGEL